MASSSRRLLAGLVDCVVPVLVAFALVYTEHLQFRVLNPDSLAFLPEHWADTYREDPLAFLSPIWALGLLCVLYQALFLALLQSSPGKRLMGLRVLGPAAAPIDPLRLLLRVVGYALSVFLLGLGWAWAFVSVSRRSLHDVLSDTFVVRRAPRRELPEEYPDDVGNSSRAVVTPQVRQARVSENGAIQEAARRAVAPAGEHQAQTGRASTDNH
ncbi:MAG: RDD family protein [Myxococcota bacterium]|jgi:uncharacterized RDD family membrane protein YckC|nr:RDD family protein [Myxococcota bacterium]